MKFYSYLWLRVDGTPYYAGKGSLRRCFGKFSHRLPRPPKDRIIIQEFETESDAFFAERFLISFYGRKDLGTGCLRNLTDGGEGVSGRKLPIESVERIRQSNIGKKASPETLIKLRESHLGVKLSEETRRRMGNAKRGKPLTIEHRAKLSQYARNRPAEHKMKLVLSRYGYTRTQFTSI